MRCKSTTVPSLDSTPFESIVRADLPQLALLRPSPVDPHVHEVAGHVSPWVNGAVKNTANYLIHFPGSDSAGGGRQLLEQAVAAAHARPRAALAVLCVMTPSQLRDTRPVDGVLYADDAVGWRRLLDVAAGPETVLVGPAGKVLWRHQGTVPPEALLAEALRTNLDDGAGHFVPEFSAPKLRAGMAAPNFLFESPAGNYLSLRALAGRPVVLCFGGAASAPARATLENLQRSASAKGALLLSIVDREASGYNADAAAPPGVIVVDDPERQIGDAYGVSLWPTTVYLNAEGLITNVRPGLIAAESRSATPAGEYERNA